MKTKIIHTWFQVLQLHTLRDHDRHPVFLRIFPLSFVFPRRITGNRTTLLKTTNTVFIHSHTLVNLRLISLRQIYPYPRNSKQIRMLKTEKTERKLVSQHNNYKN